MRLPSLNALRAFEVTARLGSVTAAADHLHVTPSAISHQLKKLEEQLGVELLIRTPKKVTLTEAGISYQRELSEAFEHLESATERLQKRQDRKTVSVTTAPSFAIKWLVPRLADFHQRHPDVDVRISSSYSVLDLRHGDFDVGIRWGKGHWPGLESRLLMHDSVQPICAPGLLVGANKPLKSTDLVNYQLIQMSFVRDDWRIWSDLHGIENPSSQKNLEFSEPLSSIQAAIDGLGIAMGPMTLVHDDIEAGRLITPFNEPILLNEAHYMAFPRQVKPNPCAETFKEWLLETAEYYSQGLPKPELSLQKGTVIYPRTFED